MDKNTKIRMTLSVVALAIMALAADLLGEREVIFPEVAALAVGLWIAGKRVWNVRNYEIPLLMTLSAVLGVLITTYAAVPLLVQLTLAFVLSALLMAGLRIPLIPSIAAILLPVLLHTQSWLYPASVAVMTTLMAVGNALLQRWGLKMALPAVTPRPAISLGIMATWLRRYLMLLPLLAVAAWRGWLFAIVPPLVIILIELSNPQNMFRNRPLPLWITSVVVAGIGTASRLLLLQQLHMPYVVAVAVAFWVSLMVMSREKMMFPPVPALAVIPFILPDNYVLFPLEVAFGAAYAISVPLLVGRLRRRRFQAAEAVCPVEK